MQGNLPVAAATARAHLEKRQNADGSESWVAVWREHGRKRKRTLGRVGEADLSQKQANQKLSELRGTLAAPPDHRRAADRSPKSHGAICSHRRAAASRASRRPSTTCSPRREHISCRSSAIARSAGSTPTTSPT